MAQKTWIRKRLFVDRRVQGALAVRIGIYWLMCLVTIAGAVGLADRHFPHHADL